MKKHSAKIIISVLVASLCISCVSCKKNANDTEETKIVVPGTNTVVETKVTVTQTETAVPTKTETKAETIPSDIPTIPAEIDISDVGSMFVYQEGVGMLSCLGDMNTLLVYPASITKLVTALTALEIATPDYVITAGEELNNVVEGSSVAYISKGAKMTLDSLLGAMLLPSGCDASYVIAQGCGRAINPNVQTANEAVAVFVNEMNNWCARNGLKGSHFSNPDGYHSDDHYMNMADILKLGQLSLNNELVKKWISTPSAQVSYLSGYTLNLENTNYLLLDKSEYKNRYCIGIKTGITIPAGKCLLSAFEKDGKRLIVGIFGCSGYNTRFKVANQVQKFYLG